MRCSATVRLAVASAQEAERLAASLGPDDAGFLVARAEGSEVVLEAEADGALSLMRTLDETLASLSAAERAQRLAG